MKRILSIYLLLILFLSQSHSVFAEQTEYLNDKQLALFNRLVTPLEAMIDRKGETYKTKVIASLKKKVITTKNADQKEALRVLIAYFSLWDGETMTILDPRAKDLSVSSDFNQTEQKQDIPRYTWGCDTPDITLSNGQVWAACNVGSNTAWVGSVSYGTYDRPTSSVCSAGYHIPSKTEWEEASSILWDKLSTTLLLPYAWYQFNDKNYLQDYGGYYSSSTQETRTTKSDEFTSSYQNYAYLMLTSQSSWSRLANVCLDNYGSVSIRCIKD